MEQEQRMLRILFLSIVVSYTKQCSDGVCLRWSVSKENLNLICKVGKLIHRIKIHDPKGNMQGDCLPPINQKHEQCDSYFKNGTIWQNTRTNETYYTVHGNIDYHVNGNWTCKHGTGVGEAYVEVSVLTIIEIKNRTQTGSTKSREKDYKGKCSCLKDALLWTMTPFISIVLISRTVLFFGSKFKKINECRNRNSKLFQLSASKAIFFLILTIIFFTVVVVVSLFDEENCYSRWIFGPLAAIFSFLSSFFILNEPKTAEQNGVGGRPSANNGNGEDSTDPLHTSLTE